jgi:hypothetical protein
MNYPRAFRGWHRSGASTCRPPAGCRLPGMIKTYSLYFSSLLQSKENFGRPTVTSCRSPSWISFLCGCFILLAYNARLQAVVINFASNQFYIVAWSVYAHFNLWWFYPFCPSSMFCFYVQKCFLSYTFCFSDDSSHHYHLLYLGILSTTFPTNGMSRICLHAS